MTIPAQYVKARYKLLSSRTAECFRNVMKLFIFLFKFHIYIGKVSFFAKKRSETINEADYIEKKNS